MSFTVNSVVVVYNLSCKLDLPASATALAPHFQVEFDASRFPGIVLYTQHDVGCTVGYAVSLFATGKCILSGVAGKHAADALMLSAIAHAVVADGCTGPVAIASSYVSNIIATAVLSTRVDLALMRRARPPRPMQLETTGPFGLRLQMPATRNKAHHLIAAECDRRHKLTVVVQKSGHLIFTGAVSLPELHVWYSRVVDFVSRFCAKPADTGDTEDEDAKLHEAMDGMVLADKD